MLILEAPCLNAGIPPGATTPKVTVTPSPSSIPRDQTLSVTVAVSGGSGNPTATGSVTLASGTYSSASTALSGGSAAISVPAGSLATGTDTLTATYLPDAASSSIYAGASGSASVMVTGPHGLPAVPDLDYPKQPVRLYLDRLRPLRGKN